ncbi:MAG: hypothetical protein JXA17_00520 [Dehalococcoidales bacterium]|nr:hypothetical protein [Dehalococcoidales bacterium]
MKKKRVIALAVIPLLVSVIFLAGCSSTESTTTNPEPTTTNIEYLKATATKLGINFSFEYPDSYAKPTPNVFEDTGGDNSISLLYRDPESTGGKADIQIYIIVCPPIPNRPDAATWTEEHIKILEYADEDFVLYDESEIEVAGISGKKIIYFTKILGDMNSEGLIIRDAYLDYRGYIWKISVMAVEEMGDQAEPIFERLLATFKFLD